MTQDFYATLGIPKGSSPEEIKKAYRKLAATHHPDRGGDTKKFQEVEEAYRVLSDPQKRAEYDNPFTGQEFFHFGGGGSPHDINEVFSHFFQHGGHNPFDFFGQRQQRNRTINLATEISLEDAFTGKDLMFNVVLPTGKNQTVNIKVPPGINDGTVLRVSGVGDDTFPNLPRGDMHLTVSVRPHPTFRRQGDDLVKELAVSCIDAMLGCKINVDTIDGKTIEVNINPGMQNGQVLSAAGYGMPNVADSRFRGRLLMPINILIPTDLTTEQIELLKQFTKG